MSSHRRAPSPSATEKSDVSRALYRARAAHYDDELAVFEPLRRQAIDWLDPQPGDTVLDIGCGTGLSLPLLCERVGPQGRVVGVEPCADMLALARQRVTDGRWRGVSLRQAEAGQARLPRHADAALFHFTHDLLQQPETVAHVLSHLRPGAAVVACGLCWAGAWNWPANAFVTGAALYSIAELDGLHAPWRHLAAAVPGLQLQRAWMGAIYLARGTLPGDRLAIQT